MQPHCTCVPQVGEGDRLMSLFCTLPKGVVSFYERSASCVDTMRMRSSRDADTLRGRALFDSFQKGERALYRVSQELPSGSRITSKRQRRRWGSEHVRWVDVTIGDVASDHLWVRFPSGQEEKLSRL